VDDSLPNARTLSENVFSTAPFTYNRARVAFMAAAWGKISVFLVDLLLNRAIVHGLMHSFVGFRYTIGKR